MVEEADARLNGNGLRRPRCMIQRYRDLNICLVRLAGHGGRSESSSSYAVDAGGGHGKRFVVLSYEASLRKGIEAQSSTAHLFEEQRGRTSSSFSPSVRSTIDAASFFAPLLTRGPSHTRYKQCGHLQ